LTHKNKKAGVGAPAGRKLSMSNFITPRRGFQSPGDYAHYVSCCISEGVEPLPPATVAELKAALENRPDYARRWLPPENECKRLGIDYAAGLPVEPLTEREQERLLVTLAADEDFRVALRALLMGGAA
jgi:hypothetical protein